VAIEVVELFVQDALLRRADVLAQLVEGADGVVEHVRQPTAAVDRLESGRPPA
jgi:hypothetical protein